VSALINHGLVDEIRLMVSPVLLGGGKALFKDVTERKHLKLVSAEQRDHHGKEVYSIYNVQSEGREGR
jgi:dihydrofolate reductase